jgi:hypothetical protein
MEGRNGEIKFEKVKKKCVPKTKKAGTTRG